jgi:hypothetical protein
MRVISLREISTGHKRSNTKNKSQAQSSWGEMTSGKFVEKENPP